MSNYPAAIDALARMSAQRAARSGSRAPMPIRQTTPDSVPILTMLRRLGYSTPDAQTAARLLMEASGLTGRTKLNIHPRKRRQVHALLRARLVRLCGSAECGRLVATARIPVKVEASDCEICLGRSTSRALLSLRSVLASRGIRRLLVVGGSPRTHRELRGAFAESVIRLDLIDGLRGPDGARSRALAANADVIVIWANTILPHAVSNQCKDRAFATKTVTITRRGTEAWAQQVMEHVTGGGEYGAH